MMPAVKIYDGQEWVYVRPNNSGTKTWTVVSNNYTTTNGDNLLCSPSSNMTITLPSNPNVGDSINIANVSNYTVNVQSTSNINSNNATAILLPQTDSVDTLVYINSTIGWKSLREKVINSDPYINSVILHLKGNGSNNSTVFTDSSPLNKTVSTFGNTIISTTQSKYGGSSIYFDGTGDYLEVPLNVNYNDYTLETFVYLSETRQHTILSGTTSGDTDVSIYSNAIWIGRAAVIWDVQVNYTFPLNQWVHIALCRVGTTHYIFVDGILIDSRTFTTTFKVATARIGTARDGSRNTFGYFDSLRVSNLGRYTSNFNPEYQFLN